MEERSEYPFESIHDLLEWVGCTHVAEFFKGLVFCYGRRLRQRIIKYTGIFIDSNGCRW